MATACPNCFTPADVPNATCRWHGITIGTINNDTGAVEPSRAALLDAWDALRAWGEAMKVDDVVRGFESGATHKERCASENAERAHRGAVRDLAVRIAAGGG